ncbi:hypothetical protein HaLaN_21676, partial [Haematococcus lacustris]
MATLLLHLLLLDLKVCLLLLQQLVLLLSHLLLPQGAREQAGKQR